MNARTPNPVFLGNCPVCRAVVDPVFPRCPRCGAELSPNPFHSSSSSGRIRPQPAAPWQLTGGHQAWIVLGVTLFCLFVTVGGALFAGHLFRPRETSAQVLARCQRELPAQMEAYYRSVGQPYPVKSVTLHEVAPYSYDGSVDYRNGYTYLLRVTMRHGDIDWTTYGSGTWHAPPTVRIPPTWLMPRPTLAVP